jgi:hypothetical protein
MMTKIRNTRSHNLPSDLEHRDPKTDLLDVEGGRYLDALLTLPQHIRAMYQDNEMHITLDKNNRVVKIIKKRDPEFLDGHVSHIWVNAEGQRLNLSEAQMDEMCGIIHDPEDVYNQQDVEMVGLESITNSEDDEDFDTDPIQGEVVEEYMPPMDRWDVIFDASAYLQHVERLFALASFMDHIQEYLYSGPRYHYVDRDGCEQYVNYFKLPLGEKIQVMNNLATEKDGISFIIGKKTFLEAITFRKMDQADRSKYLDDLSDGKVGGCEDAAIYSADFFPCVVDKRVRSSKAKDILAADMSGLTKQNIAALCDQGVDKRVNMARVLTAKATSLPLGKEKGKTILRAQSMKQSLQNAMKGMKTFRFVPEAVPEDEDDVVTEQNNRWVQRRLVVRASATQQKLVFSSERKYLWDVWRKIRILENGEEQMPSWIFKKACSAKMLKAVAKGEMTKDEALVKFQAAVKTLYNEHCEGFVVEKE